MLSARGGGGSLTGAREQKQIIYEDQESDFILYLIQLREEIK